MEVSGIDAVTSGVTRSLLIVKQLKNLMELQGELVVDLIDSSRVPGPDDLSNGNGLGGRLDIHA